VSYEALLGQLKTADQSGDELFKLVRSVAYFFQSTDTPPPEALDLIVRLVDQRDQFEDRLPGIARMIDAIVRQAGLFPYLQNSKNWRDDFALEYMRAPEMEGIYFHIEQARAFRVLTEGRSLILSAPTSFGKSLLIDALIAWGHPKTVVAAVPTISLLDEFRRRMERKFPNYQVLTRAVDQRASEHAIYIGTQ
jgi:hypothetical protein